MLILKFYTVAMFLHAVKNFVSQKTFSSKHVLFFNCKNMTSFLNYITATLWALFAWCGSYDLTLNGLLLIKILPNLNGKLEWGCPDGTNTHSGNKFKLSKLFTQISLGHILDWGECLWSLMIVGVIGKQLICVINHFQSSMYCDLDLLSPKSIEHILDSWGVGV